MRGFKIKTCVWVWLLLFSVTYISVTAQSTTAATPTTSPLRCIIGCVCTPTNVDCSDSNRTFTQVPVEELRALVQLNVAVAHLDLSNNKLTHIRSGDFRDVADTLQIIDLRGNQIISIEDEAFSSNRRLTTILLSNNSLETLPRNVFQGLILNTLDLSHNRLRAVPKALGETIVITTLLLNNNPFHTLANDSFEGINAVTHLDLSECELTEFKTCDLNFDGIFRGLSQLYLDKNKFPVLKNSSFMCLPRVTTLLSLRRCGIREIERKSFLNRYSIENLILEGNNFGTLKGQVFNSLRLRVLDISNCNITNIKRVIFKNTHISHTLYLSHNNIEVVHRDDFKFLTGIQQIDLSFSNIRLIKDRPFENLTDLNTLTLADNQLEDDSIPGLGTRGNFHFLDLTNNRLTKIPNLRIEGFPNLHSLLIGGNTIRTIQRDDLRNMSHLRELILKENRIEHIESDTFIETPNITDLDLDDMLVSHLPVMSLPRLVTLYIQNGELDYLPEDLCQTCPRLGIFEVGNNSLSSLPSFARCRRLALLNAKNNRITALSNDTIAGLPLLQLLDLRGNYIETIPDGFFRSLSSLEFVHLRSNRLSHLHRDTFAAAPALIRVDLAFNQLTDLEDGLFRNQVHTLQWLELENNALTRFSQHVLPVNSFLGRLNISSNNLKHFSFPPGGLLELLDLDLENNFDLFEVPDIAEYPNVTRIRYTYAYHCCIWSEYMRPHNDTPYTDEGSETIRKPTAPPIQLDPSLCINGEHTDESREAHLVIARIFNFSVIFLPGCKVQVNDGEDEVGTNQEDAFEFVDLRTRNKVPRIHGQLVKCSPEPDELSPCKNLMDPWFLRVMVWAVWVLALLGNGTVLFIAIAAKEKLEVYQFLICCLAFADFCMGVYLAFLAAVDIRTFGEVSFYQSALHWQNGPGCQAAGFIAVFASELSVFILVVLTLERVHTIAYTFNQNEKLKMRVAIGAAIAGVLTAAFLAVLPLEAIGINSYSKVAVCLPYVTEKWTDKLYIGCILTLNLVAFLIITFSYVYIFKNICKSPAAHQKRRDISIAAAKIALLIVTAFICWVPIAIIGYLALGEIYAVDTTQAKFLIVFVYPLNACLNPFIYAIFTRQFRQKLSMVFKRSSDRVNSLPSSRRIRLQRGSSAFLPDHFRTSSPRGNNPSPMELMKMRQSRRSNSLSVQLVNNNNPPQIPSPPALTPPPGAYMGRRASLPAAFGSTLRTLQTGPVDSHKGSLTSNNSVTGMDALSFNFAANFNSGENSSQPNLEQDDDTACVPPCNLQSSLGGSQESANRQLPDIPEEQEEENVSMCSTDSEDYSDAQDEVYIDPEDRLDTDEIMPKLCVEIDSELSAAPSISSLCGVDQDLNSTRTKCKMSSDSTCSGYNSVTPEDDIVRLVHRREVASPARSCSLSMENESFSSYDMVVSDSDCAMRDSLSPAHSSTPHRCKCSRGSTPTPMSGRTKFCTGVPNKLSFVTRHHETAIEHVDCSVEEPDTDTNYFSRDSSPTGGSISNGSSIKLKPIKVPTKTSSPHRNNDSFSNSQISIVGSETSV